MEYVFTIGYALVKKVSSRYATAKDVLSVISTGNKSYFIFIEKDVIHLLYQNHVLE